MTVLSKFIEVVEEEADTRPLASNPCLCLSCTLIMSPGRKKAAFNPVVKETTSPSFLTVARCQSASRLACPSEVQPNATISFGIIFPTTVKAKYFMIFWFVSQIFIVFQNNNISWEAHIGGFVIGYFSMKLLNNR